MTGQPDLSDDAGRRFEELVASLEERRSAFTDESILRMAATTALTIPGNPSDVAESIERTAAEIHRRVPWYRTHRGSVRFLLASILVQEGDTVEAFLAELARGNSLFRDLQVRRGAIFETLAILLLRIHRDRRPIPESDVARFKEVYAEMKRHHWWLTGPDDFPACALLVGASGDPAHLGAEMESLYRGLVAGGCKVSDPLQTASHLLALDAHRSVNERVHAFHALREAFSAAGERVDATAYDDLATLAILRAPPEVTVQATIDHRRGVARLRPATPHPVAFAIGAALAFLDLVRSAANRPSSGPLQDSRALLRHQHLAACVTMSSLLAAARIN